MSTSIAFHDVTKLDFGEPTHFYSRGQRMYSRHIRIEMGEAVQEILFIGDSESALGEVEDDLHVLEGPGAEAYIKDTFANMKEKSHGA